jgi:YhcH/YjgK/YiaL family protein
MIIDRLGNASLYVRLGDGLARAFRYLQSTDLGALPAGRVDIDGDRLFALVQDYETRPREAGRWEAHRRYIDVQFVVRGEESIGYADMAALPAGPYESDKDIQFADGGDGSFVTVPAGTFVVLWPGEAHMPGMAGRPPGRVRKIVVKVKHEHG